MLFGEREGFSNRRGKRPHNNYNNNNQSQVEVSDAAVEAARFVGRSIMNTMDQPEHFYGVNFEGVIANKDTPSH